jgi:hypothetical protein
LNDVICFVFTVFEIFVFNSNTIEIKKTGLY